jgi:type II secretory pathway component PulJ
MLPIHKKSGFTFLEIIIAVGLSALVVLAVGKFAGTITNIGVLLNSGLQANQDLTSVFRTITTDMRGMELSAAGGYPIEAASTSSLTFFSDIDQNGTAERVRYFLGTSTLEQGITKAATSSPWYPTSTEVVSVIVPNVLIASSSFQYFGVGYSGTSSPLAMPALITDIRVVKLTLASELSTSTAPRPAVFSTTVTIRNLRGDD